MKNRRGRIYWRSRGGELRAYADFRDLGAGQEALIPPGETRATTDAVIAEALVGKRLEQLQEQRRDSVLLGVRRRTSLQEYAAEHLRKKARSSNVTDRHLADSERRLRVAIEFFSDRDLTTIGVEHVQEFVHHLAEKENARGGTLSPSTQRKYLSALSNLFRRAQGEGIIRGVNPVEALLDKPTAQPAEAPWLEVWEGALLLEAARTFPYQTPEGSNAGGRLRDAIRETLGQGVAAESEFLRRMREAGKLASAESLAAYLSGDRVPARDYLSAAARALEIPEESLLRERGWLAGPRARPSPLMHPLLGTFLLTGGRRAEVFGLELGDVSLARGVVTFRPNRWRRLKTKTSRRSVPLWPQLREILEPYVDAQRSDGAEDEDLLFPSPQTGGMLYDVGKALDTIAKSAGWRAGEVRPKAFRHAYASARVQTLDRGYPVSDFVVAKEMGHGGFELVKRVYGHLGQIRHRSEFVEYRIDQQREVIPPERLRGLLRAV